MESNEIVHADGHIGPIETLDQAKRAMFNGAYRGLRFQGWKQANSGTSLGMCYTRITSCDGTLSCALGWLAPDAKLAKTRVRYQPGVDLCGAPTFAEMAEPISDYYVRCYSKPQELHQIGEFARRLQHLHDCSKSPEDMKQKFEAFRELHQWPVPSEV